MEKFFVSRPIFAISLAIVIVLVGLISIMGLPIEQYPDITPPVVEVSATYDGADAETVNNAVATPVAQSRDGRQRHALHAGHRVPTTVRWCCRSVFDVGYRSRPRRHLHPEQRLVGHGRTASRDGHHGRASRRSKTMTGFLMVYSLHSDGRYDGEFLSNYAYINLQNELLKIDGVGKVSIMGAGEYAMRVWLRARSC